MSPITLHPVTMISLLIAVFFLAAFLIYFFEGRDAEIRHVNADDMEYEDGLFVIKILSESLRDNDFAKITGKDVQSDIASIVNSVFDE